MPTHTAQYAVLLLVTEGTVHEPLTALTDPDCGLLVLVSAA
jgi:hypothetical protein